MKYNKKYSKKDVIRDFIFATMCVIIAYIVVKPHTKVWFYLTGVLFVYNFVYTPVLARLILKHYRITIDKC